MSQPRNPGLVIHHDIRNENFLARDGILRKAIQEQTVRPVNEGFIPKTKSHRQYKYYDQGQTPKCTAFGTLTYLATANPFNRPTVGKKTLDGHELYTMIQQEDIRNGYHFDEGATVTAALEVARRFGWIERYEWMYTIKSMQQLILIAPLLAGTYWYDSMSERDAEGIVKSPRSFDTTDSGHLYDIHKYDAKRDIWWVANTWGDGDYGIPGDLMHRLVREEGEIAIATEIDFTP